jgi:hypothetical protein
MDYFSDADAFCLRIQESQAVEIASQILDHLDPPDEAAVNRLDDPSGSKMAGGSATGSKGVSEIPKKNGEPWWDRTTDPLIKSSDPGQPEHTQDGLSLPEIDNQG